MGNQQPSLNEGSKVCRRCHKTQPIEWFRLVNNSGRVYRLNTCKTCVAKQVSEYQRGNRETYNENMRRFRRENLEHVREYGRNSARNFRKKQCAKVHAAYGGKCVCCGETEPLFLAIDHIKNDGHRERKTKPPGSFYGRIVRAGFPKRYQLLCYNCNVGKHRNGGICPHQKGSTTRATARTAKRREARNTPSG